MIRYNKLPKNISSLIPEAASYLHSVQQVEFAYLFGGLVKHGVRPLSDVDIAVHLDPNTNMTEAKLDILGCLMDILRTDEIDLVILNQAPLPLKMSILRNKEILVDKKPFVRHAYESLIMREYFDFSYLERNILQGRYFNG
jgi:uncharacterized protein